MPNLVPIKSSSDPLANQAVDPAAMDEEAYMKFLQEAYGGGDQQAMFDSIAAKNSLNYQDNGPTGAP